MLIVDFTTIVAVVSVIGVIGALIFNGLNLRKDQKSRYYDAFKDLYHEMSIIYDQPRDVIRVQFFDYDELKKLPKEIQDRTKKFRIDYVNFHEKVAHLVSMNIISKPIARFFSSTFPVALLFLDLLPKDAQGEEGGGYLRDWCKNEKIEKYKVKSYEKSL